MMKQYLIGRGDDCQIRIQDNSQRISRSHATLKIMDNGKIFITDHSSNGTFVNGVKISQNVDFPVKRGDSISFANVAEFNWAQIPKTQNKVILYIGGAIIIIGIGMSILFFMNRPYPKPEPTIQRIDSTKIKKQERQKAISDSIRITKIVQDSIEAKKKRITKIEPQKTDKKKPKEKKAEADTTKKETKQPIFL